MLQGTPSVTADPSYTLTIYGHPIMKDGTSLKVNSDDIALTAAMLASKVEYLGRFTTTDGMIFDKKGNLYLGDLERYRIVKIDPHLHMSVLIEDHRLIWPDSYQVSDDGYLYVSCSQIHRQPAYNNGVNKRTTPYKIYKIKLT